MFLHPEGIERTQSGVSTWGSTPGLEFGHFSAQRCPGGTTDRSLARSAWQSVSKEPSRRVRYDRA
jgi:hypothetical protein